MALRRPLLGKPLLGGAALLLCWNVLAAPPQQAAPQAMDLESRLDRVERMLESGTLVEMLNRLDSLQREVQQLRGDLEEQAYTLENLKRHQRELYLDIDRRLSRLEREGVAAGTPAGAPEQAPGQGGLAPTAPATAATPLTAPGAAAAATTAAAPSPAQAAEERKAYQAAFDLLRELRYEQATTAFTAFLKEYPEGRYAHIAQYWLGEANYAQRNFKQAITEYGRLIVRHPKSPKQAEAMLKIGYSHYELGDKAAAQTMLDKLVAQFPDTTEAGQAHNLLQRIKRGN